MMSTASSRDFFCGSDESPEDHDLSLALAASLKDEEDEKKKRDLDLAGLSEEERLSLAIELSKQNDKYSHENVLTISSSSSDDEDDPELAQALRLSKMESSKMEVTPSQEENIYTISPSEEDRDLLEAIRVSRTATPTPSVSFTYNDDEELKKALMLSLDPNEQNNDQHREFLNFLTRKENERELQIHEPSSSSENEEEEIAKASNKVDQFTVNGLTEEEQFQIAMMRSSKNLPEIPSTSYSSRVQNGIADVSSLPRRPPVERSPYATPSNSKPKKGSLRPIIVDGCNVAYAHGNHEHYSARGLKLLYDHFVRLGHKDIVIFVRNYDKLGAKNREILDELKKLNVLTVCPSSRIVAGRHISHYDDLMLVEYASRVKGIIVSGDKYRDIINHSKEFQDQIKNRLLTFEWVRDELMLVQDPLGRNGPNLKDFLRY